MLIDFGSARFESGQATSTQVTFYTPPYAAIEQYVKTYAQGPWTDIYALGVALYQCVSGEKPPEVLERLHGGLGEALSARERPGFSRAFTRAIDAAMAIRPAERPQSIPDWLALFEQRDCADDDATRIGGVGIDPLVDDATRIAAFEPSSAHLGQEAPPAPVAVAPTTAPDSAEVAPAQRRWIIPVAGLAVIVMAVAAGALLLARARQPAPAGPEPAAIARIASPTPTAPAAMVRIAPAPPVVVPSGLEPAADALVADARRANRPSGEISALVDARARLNDLSAQIQASGAASGAPAGATLLAALNSQATAMAEGEAKGLAAAAGARRREVEHRLGDSRQGSDAVRNAQARLDSTVGAVTSGQDPVAALNGARQALTDYAILSGAYDRATRLIAPAKRATIASIAYRARADADEVVSLSSISRPWLFASRAHKQNYQTLQSDAAQARGLLAELNALSPASNDVNRLDAVLAKASEIRRDLARLEASASATARDNVAPTP